MMGLVKSHEPMSTESLASEMLHIVVRGYKVSSPVPSTTFMRYQSFATPWLLYAQRLLGFGNF